MIVVWNDGLAWYFGFEVLNYNSHAWVIDFPYLDYVHPHYPPWPIVQLIFWSYQINVSWSTFHNNVAARLCKTKQNRNFKKKTTVPGKKKKSTFYFKYLCFPKKNCPVRFSFISTASFETYVFLLYQALNGVFHKTSKVTKH